MPTPWSKHRRWMVRNYETFAAEVARRQEECGPTIWKRLAEEFVRDKRAAPGTTPNALRNAWERVRANPPPPKPPPPPEVPSFVTVHGAAEAEAERPGQATQPEETPQDRLDEEFAKRRPKLPPRLEDE